MGDRLLAVSEADIVADLGTTFFQEPHLASNDDLPPTGVEVLVNPDVAYDTFVTVGLLTDDAGQISAQPISATGTNVDGSWFTTDGPRDAATVCVDPASPLPDNYGVLIAQITIDGTVGGYSGTVRLYLSTLDDGSLVGVDVPVAYQIPFDKEDADLDGDGCVGFTDLTTLLALWGPCLGCQADFDDNGCVGFTDLTTLLAQWDKCLPDVNCDNFVDISDVLLVLQDFGLCPGCATDLNDDDVVNNVDLAYVLENFGPCPAGGVSPGSSELFDEVVAVDVTDAAAAALDLLVTNVYATGSGVGLGDRLLAVTEADIDADSGTTLFQEPQSGDDDTPPTSVEIVINPPVAYDTFVTVGLLTDDSGDVTAQPISVTGTSVDGSWFTSTGSRSAVDISALTGNPGQNGVLIAQITIDLAASGGAGGYSGNVRLYTSSFDDGSLDGVDAAVSFSGP